jgi:hypothetical protein
MTIAVATANTNSAIRIAATITRGSIGSLRQEESRLAMLDDKAENGRLFPGKSALNRKRSFASCPERAKKIASR